MKQTLLTALLLLLTATTAHAENSCHLIGRGYLVINRRTDTMYGGNFFAQISCTRYAPVLIHWLGGPMCPGQYFYAHTNARAAFSCVVRRIGRR